MKIGAEINQALSALDRQVQIAKNTAGLAVYNDKQDRAAADEADASDEVTQSADAGDDADTPLGNNLDVEA